MKKPQPNDEPLTYRSALSMDIDAFLWISAELERIWSALVIAANTPVPQTINRIAAEMYFIVEESKQFAMQSQDDLVTLEKKAVTITVNGSSDTQTYTGEPLTSRTDVTLSCSDDLFDADKFNYCGAKTITETDADTYTEAIDITKAAYDDANLDVTFVKGTDVSFTLEKEAGNNEQDPINSGDG